MKPGPPGPFGQQGEGHTHTHTPPALPDKMPERGPQSIPSEAGGLSLPPKQGGHLSTDNPYTHSQQSSRAASLPGAPGSCLARLLLQVPLREHGRTFFLQSQAAATLPQGLSSPQEAPLAPPEWLGAGGGRSGGAWWLFWVSRKLNDAPAAPYRQQRGRGTKWYIAWSRAVGENVRQSQRRGELQPKGSFLLLKAFIRCQESPQKAQH